MQRVIVTLALILGASSASAQQGYIIQTPGQMPTFANPTPGGGFAIQRPGGMTGFVNPSFGNGYVYQPPGQMPSNLTPMPRMPCMPTVFHRC